MKNHGVLKEVFISTCCRFTSDAAEILSLYREIQDKHSDEGRFYHTLGHLENIFYHLLPVKDKINNWESVIFSIFYHDFIYDVSKDDNEEMSAQYASAAIAKIHVPNEIIIQVSNIIIILATKKHSLSENKDINYFTDADLSILGQNWYIHYLLYSKNIRKEYSIYYDAVYTAGRIKVLEYFLGLERIYKTDFFHKKFGKSAKENIYKEIAMLSQKY